MIVPASAPVDPMERPSKLRALASLTRLDRPIGILLLLWPMFWALWFAAGGMPPLCTLTIFTAGAVLTRSAGCAINDFADRKIDGHVARTRQRPLATGALAPRDALLATAVLMAFAFILVLLTNRLTIVLSFVALALAVAYPFTKRFTHYPQLVLGAAFGFAVPMAFAAIDNAVPGIGWALFIAALIWAVAYDTLYAMTDRDDDLLLGVKSTAVRFGRFDIALVAGAHLLTLAILGAVGWSDGRGAFWYAGLAIALLLAIRQWRAVRTREPAACFAAFMNNNVFGGVIFAGLVLDTLAFGN